MTAPPPPDGDSPPVADGSAPHGRGAALALSLATVRALTWRAIPAAAVALAAGLLLVRAVYVLAAPLALLLLAIAIAEGLDPLVSRLERRMPRALAGAVVYLLLLLLLGFAGWYVVPRLVAQVTALVQRSPAIITNAQLLMGRWDRELGGQLGSVLSSALGKFSGLLLVLPRALLVGVATVLILVFLSYYWVVTQPTLVRFLLSLFPRPERPGATSVLAEMGHAMGGYVRGVAISAVCTGTIAGIGLFVIGFDYPVLAIVLTALGELVPIIGATVVGIIVTLIGLVHSLSRAGLCVAVYTIVINVEGHVLTPNIMRSQTRVPQTLVIFALAAGAALGGLIGAIVAIPAAAALRVFVLRVVAPAVRRYTGAEAQLRETGAPPP